MAKNFLSMGFIDASQEPGSLRVNTEDTPGGGEIAALIAALNNMTTMRLKDYSQGAYTLNSSLAGTGYREMKFLVRCHDSVNMTKWSFTIPGGSSSLVTMITGTDFVDLTVGNPATLKTAIEAVVVTPWYNNTVVVDSIELTRGQK